MYFLSCFIPCLIYLLSFKYFPVDFIPQVMSYNIKSVIDMFFYYISEFRLYFCDVSHLSYYYLILLFILSIIGIIKNYKKEIVILINLCTFFFYLFFHDYQGLRYIFPVIPFLVIFIALGFNYIKNINIKLYYVISFAIICLILFNGKSTLAGMHHSIGECLQHNYYGVTGNDSDDIYEYIRNNTKVDDKIIYPFPRAVSLFTDRLSFQISDDLYKLKNADYHLDIYSLDGAPAQYYMRQMFNYNKKTYIDGADVYLNPIYKNNKYILYKILKK